LHWPDAKIAVFWRNDHSGKDPFKGLRDGHGDKAGMIIADKSYPAPAISTRVAPPPSGNGSTVGGSQ
jgi:hypothetical protein